MLKCKHCGNKEDFEVYAGKKIYVYRQNGPGAYQVIAINDAVKRAKKEKWFCDHCGAEIKN